MTVLAPFWNWDGWNALVAIGTLTLAIGTGFLAWMTKDAVSESRRQINLSADELKAIEKQTDVLTKQTEAVQAQAAATERQVSISTAALEASARPVLVGVAPSSNVEREDVTYTDGHVVNVEVARVHYEETDDMVYCSVPLRNVGAGVAFVQRVSLLTRTPYEGRISNPVVPPDEIARARFAITRRQRDGRATDVNEITTQGRGFAAFTIYVVFTAASHDLVTASKVTVAGLPDGTFLVTGNEILDGEAQQRLLASSANVG